MSVHLVDPIARERQMLPRHLLLVDPPREFHVSLDVETFRTHGRIRPDFPLHHVASSLSPTQGA